MSLQAALDSYARRDALVTRLMKAISTSLSIDEPTPEETATALRRFVVIVEEALDSEEEKS